MTVEIIFSLFINALAILDAHWLEEKFNFKVEVRERAYMYVQPEDVDLEKRLITQPISWNLYPTFIRDFSSLQQKP